MRQCPVCKTGCRNIDICPTCGFDQLDVEFLNRDETEVWVENVVKPLREKYFNWILNINNDEYEIENGVLKKYKGHASNVVVPYGITSIGDKAFYECGSLTSIDIPDSVTSIGNHAFLGCKNLTSIDIPDSVTSIGDGAFYRCNMLSDSDGFVIIRNTLHYYAGDSLHASIPDGVTYIGGFAFVNCSSLTSINIQDGVTYIGEYAFLGCASLKSIKISDSVTSIGAAAFWGCASLKSIKIPDGVTSIGGAAFERCDCVNLLLNIHMNSYAETYAKRNCLNYQYI